MTTRTCVGVVCRLYSDVGIGLAFKIHEENQKGIAIHVPMAGLAIGDGWVDPITQLGAYPDMLFNIGVVSTKLSCVLLGTPAYHCAMW